MAGGAPLTAPTALLEVQDGSGPYTTSSCVSSISLAWNFRGTGSTDPETDIASWSIDFGDATATGTQSWTGNPPVSVPHVYPDQGDYFVVLTVTDATAASHSDTTHIYIFSPPVRALDTGPCPTAVSVRTFSASRTGSGTRLRWRTASETQTLGFNLYRQQRNLVKLNRALILRVFGGTASGHAYTWRDRRAPRGAARYRLQAVSLSGKRSWVGSATVAR